MASEGGVLVLLSVTLSFRLGRYLVTLCCAWLFECGAVLMYRVGGPQSCCPCWLAGSDTFTSATGHWRSSGVPAVAVVAGSIGMQ